MFIFHTYANIKWLSYIFWAIIFGFGVGGNASVRYNEAAAIFQSIRYTQLYIKQHTHILNKTCYIPW